MFNLKSFNKKSGFSLVELILSLAIISVLTSSMIVVLSYVNKATSIKGKKLDAVSYAQEGLEAIFSIRDSNYSELDPGSSPQMYKLQIPENEDYWELIGVSDEDEIESTTKGLKRIIEIERVLADGDPVVARIVKVTVTVKWTTFAGLTDSVTIDSLVSNWIAETSAVVQNSWCDPEVAENFSSYESRDVEGVSRGRRVAVGSAGGNTGNIAIATGLDFTAGSKTFVKYPYNSSNVLVPTSTTGYISKAIATLGNYVYVASDSNKEELVIYDVSNATTKVGFFNATNCDCKQPVDIQLRTISATKIAYMLMNDKFIAVDISTPNGVQSQTELGSKSLTRRASAFYVQGNYAYIGYEKNDNNTHISVLNISNLNSITQVSQFNLGNNIVEDIKQIYVSENSDELYVLTEYAETADELYLVDSSTPSALSVIDSYDSGSIIPNAFAVTSSENIVLAGEESGGGTIELVNIGRDINEIPQSLQACGGGGTLPDTPFDIVYDMDTRVNSEIRDVDGVLTQVNTTYVYLITNDDQELKIIKGQSSDVNENIDENKRPIQRIN